MSGPDVIIALAGIAGGTAIFMTPVFIVRNILAHREKIARIRQGLEGNVNGLTPAEVEAFRHEIVALRETTTRFDMSFDAALARVEERLDSLETVQATQNEDAIAAQRGGGYGPPLTVERREYKTTTISPTIEEAATVPLGRR